MQRVPRNKIGNHLPNHVIPHPNVNLDDRRLIHLSTYLLCFSRIKEHEFLSRNDCHESMHCYDGNKLTHSDTSISPPQLRSCNEYQQGGGTAKHHRPRAPPSQYQKSSKGDAVKFLVGTKEFQDAIKVLAEILYF